MSDNSNMTATESSTRASEAIDLATKINDLCAGRDTISVFMALSIVIGQATARAERPNFEGLTGLLVQHAWNIFNDEMGRRTNG